MNKRKPSETESMNIVLIISDTFRRDHLGCYGSLDTWTPNIDRLADNSILFERCYACSFPTMPARSDLFTGRWTYTYMGWEPLSEREELLSSILQSGGYLTKAVVDTPFLKGYGYDRGFNDFEWNRGQFSGAMGKGSKSVIQKKEFEGDYCAPTTILSAERWLQHHRKNKFFLYIDTWDPHEPWNPPHYYTERYHSEYDGRLVSPCYGLWKDLGVSDEELRIAHASYRGEISMVDRWIGFLLESLEALNLMDNTIIIFTTDHGFYFGEHEIFGKMVKSKMDGKTKRITYGTSWDRSPLYEEVAHILLLIRIPSFKPGKLESLVSLPDVMPTILDLAGMKSPPIVQAKSVVPLLKGERKKNWEFVVTTHPLVQAGKMTRAVDDQRRKLRVNQPSTISSNEYSLIYSVTGEPAELYYLPSDPKQQKNMVDAYKDVVNNLIKSYASRLIESHVDDGLTNLRLSL